MKPPVTDAEYRRQLNLLSGEIGEAAILYHQYEALNRLALDDEAVPNVLNLEPQFWRAHQHCAQAMMFITLGRIFDSDDHNYTIQRLLNATTGNLDLFSRDALAARKRELSPGEEPIWLLDYLSDAWFPTEPNDVRFLKKELRPHWKTFDQIYRPIRHTIAHRIMSDDEAGYQYFSRTNRKEVGEIIHFLRDLIGVLIDLYWNGRKPQLGQRDFSGEDERIRDEVRQVITTLKGRTGQSA
jgi:hypothetical protein